MGQLQRSIEEVKRSREMRNRYMWFELMLRDEYRKGINEGEVKGKVEDILDLLDELGVVSSSLR
ncbi:MAG: hypothetical protein ACI4DN_11320 [Lachnospiraceae bacterium]